LLKNHLDEKMIYRTRRFLKRVLPKGKTPAVPMATQPIFDAPDLGNWYSPVLLGASTIGEKATHTDVLHQVIEVIDRLEPDDYVRYLRAYYKAGIGRFGDAWRYADIVTVLMAAAQLARPMRYLEIGVRRGRSMAMVAATCPECDIVGFDLWQTDYAGMPNPGPDLVIAEMKKLGYRGRLELISGNSHETLPRYLRQHPNIYFDLVTVDGDHSEKGAMLDLLAVISRLKIGGILVFDDICHPTLPYLYSVWQRAISRYKKFATWVFSELGYGVALAVRKEA
jgi:predicted O-methyltransferase YrrM